MELNRHYLPLLFDSLPPRTNDKIKTTVRIPALPFLDPMRTALDDANLTGEKYGSVSRAVFVWRSQL